MSIRQLGRQLLFSSDTIKKPPPFISVVERAESNKLITVFLRVISVYADNRSSYFEREAHHAIELKQIKHPE